MIVIERRAPSWLMGSGCRDRDADEAAVFGDGIFFGMEGRGRAPRDFKVDFSFRERTDGSGDYSLQHTRFLNLRASLSSIFEVQFSTFLLSHSLISSCDNGKSCFSKYHPLCRFGGWRNTLRCPFRALLTNMLVYLAGQTCWIRDACRRFSRLSLLYYLDFTYGRFPT